MGHIIDNSIYIIVDLLKNKMDESNYNDIKTFINNNLNKDIIKETIYNQLLKNDISYNENIIINEYKSSFFYAIQIYKEHFNNNELTELIELLCNKTYDIDYIVSHYNPNKNEVMFYAKLALAIIYDDFINNYDYENRIINHLTRNDDDDDDDDEDL
jgi:hypothetical protein